MKRLFFVACAAIMLLPASAMAKDRNHDRLPDGWERANSLSLKVKQTKRDQDRDGVRNLQEYRHGMDPRDDDSDGDGTEDGAEAGQIVSFDATSGTLVIDLVDGQQLSGQVTDATEIECGASDDPSSDDEGDDRGDTEGDNEGDNESDDDDAVMSHHGDDDEGDDDGSDHDHSCATDVLAPGAAVHEAQLTATGAGAVWDEIELV